MPNLDAHPLIGDPQSVAIDADKLVHTVAEHLRAYAR